VKKGYSSIAITCWRLDKAGRTAAFASFEGGTPCLVHFGASLPQTEDLNLLARLTLPHTTGGQLDPLTPMSLMPSAIEGWQGHPGLNLLSANGQSAAPDLALAEAAHEDGRLIFKLSDRLDRVSLKLDIELDGAGLLSMSATAIPRTGSRIGWLSAGAVPVPDRLPRILDHGGRWTGEFEKQERLFATGQHARKPRGPDRACAFPGCVFLAEDCGETSGECLGVSLAWSGGHRMIAEEIPDGRRQVQFGVADDGVSDQPLSSPKVFLAWSNDGLNGVSEPFHELGRRFARPNLQAARYQAPVHYNCWEAVYFRHKRRRSSNRSRPGRRTRRRTFRA
jgi:alpha-galactosidase